MTKSRQEQTLTPYNKEDQNSISEGIQEVNLQKNQVVDLKSVADTSDSYKNLPVALANDHVVRLSVMTEPYFWHYHPNSDEVFIVIEGTLIIELENQTIELHQHQLYTIKSNTPHRTRPKNERSTNLTISSSSIKTKKLSAKD